MKRFPLLLALLLPLAACDSPTGPEPEPGIGPCDMVGGDCRPVDAISLTAEDVMTLYTGQWPNTRRWVAPSEWNGKVKVGDLFRCPWE